MAVAFAARVGVMERPFVNHRARRGAREPHTGMNVASLSGAAPEPLMDLNTTPLIDVMLVLLVLLVLVMLILTIPMQLHTIPLSMGSEPFPG